MCVYDVFGNVFVIEVGDFFVEDEVFQQCGFLRFLLQGVLVVCYWDVLIGGYCWVVVVGVLVQFIVIVVVVVFGCVFVGWFVGGYEGFWIIKGIMILELNLLNLGLVKVNVWVKVGLGMFVLCELSLLILKFCLMLFWMCCFLLRIVRGGIFMLIRLCCEGWVCVCVRM